MAPQARNLYLLVILAFAVALSIYALNSGDYMVHDSTVVLSDKELTIDGGDFDEWRIASQSIKTGPLGRPISLLSFAAQHAISDGFDLVILKITNAVIHGLCGLFLWLFLVRVLAVSPVTAYSRNQAQLLASVTVAVWLMHPLHASTVIYTVQRMTQLAALFTFIGLWQVFRLRARWLERAPTPEDYSRLLLVGFIWTALAALSKENGLLLPLFVAVVELCLFRFRIAGGESRLLKWGVLGTLIGLASLLVLFPLLRPEFIETWYSVRDYTLSERVLTQSRLLWQYLGWLIVPDIWSMGLHHDDIALSTSLLDPPTTMLALLGFAALAIVSWWQRDRRPLLAFAVLWYLVGHAMESTIVPLELIYEHRNYAPAVGPLLLLATLVLVRDSRYIKPARWALGAFILCLPVLLYTRTAPWTTSLSYAESAYRNNPDSMRALLFASSAYFSAATASTEPEVVEQYFATSKLAALKGLELDPDNMATLSWLITLDSHSNDPSRIPEWYERLQQAMLKPALHATEVIFLDRLTKCVSRGDCQAPAGGYQQFLVALNEQHPEKSNLIVMLANYCLDLDRLDCARNAAERLLATGTRDPYSYSLLYNINSAAGDQVAAMEMLHMLLKEDRDRFNLRAVRDHFQRIAVAERGMQAEPTPDPGTAATL